MLIHKQLECSILSLLLIGQPTGQSSRIFSFSYSFFNPYWPRSQVDLQKLVRTLKPWPDGSPPPAMENTTNKWHQDCKYGPSALWVVIITDQSRITESA
jgi:hypothetical protein